MDVRKRTRKLNFNAPLLSVRRPELSRAKSRADSLDASDRVPFSWELAAGRPKDVETSSSSRDDEPPPPTPPPRQWHRWKQKQAATHNKLGVDFDDDDDTDDFSDALDMFSLSDTMEMVDRGCGEGKEEFGVGGDGSPDFMIRRFLPAANALAASSAMKHFNREVAGGSRDYCLGGHAAPRGAAVVGESPSSCGVEVFFPWRMKRGLCGVKSTVVKHRVCGVKKPVRQVESSAKPIMGPTDPTPRTARDSILKFVAGDEM